MKKEFNLCHKLKFFYLVYHSLNYLKPMTRVAKMKGVENQCLRKILNSFIK